MGSDATVIFFGIRHTITSDEELERLEEGNDDRLRACRRFKLVSRLGRIMDGEPHHLLIGQLIGVVGIENVTSLSKPPDELQHLVNDTKSKLTEAGFNAGNAAIHVILEADD